MSYKAKIVDSQIKFTNKFIKALQPHFNKWYKRKVDSFRNRIKTFARDYLKNTDIYLDLIGGQLMGELGLEKGLSKKRVDALVNFVTRNIKVTITKDTIAQNNMLISQNLQEIEPQTFIDATNIPEGTIEYTKRSKTRTIKEELVELRWIEWILTMGDRIIVHEFHVETGGVGEEGPKKYGNLVGSRSGKALMKAGGSWSVPDIAGLGNKTINSNWITEALSSQDFQDKVQDLLLRIFNEGI